MVIPLPQVNPPSEVEFSILEEFCIKRSKFTDSQIMYALKWVDAGLAVPDACFELSISSDTFCKWPAKYGGMDISMMARMKELEAKNAWLM
jgi:putative transposase